ANGAGGFSDPLAVANPLGLALDFGATGIVTGDFNADGRMGLAIAPATGFAVSGQLLVYLGQGDGSFTAQPGLTVTGTLDGPLVTGDFNRDGRLDLAAGSGLVFLGQAGGAFVQSTSTLAGGLEKMLVADFDHDGILDLAGVNPFSRELLISLGRGDGSFVAQPALMLNGNVNLTIGDFNGDGIVDLAMGTAGTVSVLLGRGISGQAAFAPALRFDTGDNSSFGSNTLTAGDLNGDGRIDLAMTQLDLEASALSHTSIHQLRWFFGRGDGSFQSAPIVRVGQSPTAIARGDFNRDGNVDLVVANLRSNDVSVLISAGDGTFADEIRYPVGAGPVQVVVGEFNADGRLDFAVQTAGGVSIFLGIGDGSFKLGGTFNSASGIMVAADFNGDGLTDLAIANEVYLAGPGMTFTRVSALLPGSVSAAADFNGDRILDLVLDFGGPFIALGNNDGTGHGNGTFTVMANSFRANAGGSLTTIADILSTSELNLTFPLGVVPTADFDGDGKRDLVIPVLDQTNPFLVIQTVLIFRGDSDGTFTLSGSLGVAAFADSRYSLDTGDFNGDGRDDLAVTTFNQFTDTTGQARVYLSEGIALPGADVQFSTIFVGPTGTFPVAVAVADLNGDKRPDLVTVDEGPESLSIFLNRGDGGFLNADEFVATTLQARPILTDVDGDGTADSLVLTQGGEILFRRGRPGQPGNFDAPVLINPGRPVRDLAVVTQNGKARLAALNLQPDQVSGLNQDFIVFYDWNPATKTFVRVQGPLISSLPTRIVAGDVTGDLREDLVVLSADGTLQVFASSGSSFVPAGAPLNVGAVPGLLALGNVDGVTGLDLIVGQPDAGEVRIVPIVPAPTFGAPLLFRTGAGLYESGSGALARELTWSIQVADFNRDSILDLVVTNRNANTFALLLGQGAGTFSEPRVFATGSLPTEIVVGDFSNDNRLDVAVLNLNDATVTVYLGDGLGNFFLAATVAAGNLPNGLASNDVNADGNLDLVIQNEFGDLLFILGNGNGTFRPFVRAGGNVPFVTTDINGDGVADVLLANQSVDQVLSQIRNAGSTTFSLGGFSQTSADGVQAPGFVDLEDINNDGIQDLLVTNTGSNNIIVYLGTAPGQFSSNGLSFFTGTSPVSATVFDFNGDNLADVAVANQGSNDVSILLGSVDASGNWTLTTGPRLDVGLGPNNIAINDFDGDGTLDLMVTSGQAGQLWMLPGLGNGFFDDGNPTILSLPGQIVQTLYTLTTGFTLLQSGSIFNFNPFSLTTATNVFNSAANALVTALTFVPNSTSFFAGRSDSSIALLNADAGGNYAESLIFSDARLDSPSALSVVGNELYVTNQGSSLPLVFGLDGLFAPGIDFGSGFDDPTGSVTTLDSIDQARLSVIATVLASAGSSNTDEEASDEEGDENAFVAGLNAGLIGSTSLLGLLLAQEVSAESGDEEVSEEGEAEQETPVWVEFVVGLQDAIDEFRASLLQDQDDAVATTALDRWLAEVARWLAATTSDKGNGTAMPSHALASNDAQVGAATARPGQEEAVLPMAQAAQPADAEALAALPEALFDLPVLWREWWPALAAATLTSCAWLGWRQKRNSSERSSR
ncbi:MAG: FG-GAP repeat domain-containing protein, partial [Gemmataceae bacterium]